MAQAKRKISPDFNAAAALKTFDILGNPVHVIDPDNPKSLALLEKAYKEIYEPAFPMDDERESMENWLDNMKDADAHLRIVIALIGTGLDTDTPTIKGISVGEYYPRQDVGLLAYNAIAPEFRNQGLGHAMVEARKQALLDLARKNGGVLQGVFIECNDPEKVSPGEDSMDPVVRLKIFGKWGARIIPVDYVQPALEEGLDKCETLKLLAYPHPETGEYPTPEGIRCIINGIYDALSEEQGTDLRQDPDYIRTMRQLDAMEEQKPFLQKTAP